ncbi:MAG: glycosyltransferase family 4 protein [Leptolyngbyaceae cyanobacterium bins.59]|nr:glycosyltransferase family 4 protein [Leptolyngbyaceae cyanobacterium bins.59]
MNILMLSSTFPYPPTRGGTQVRTFNLLKYLSERHSITLITQRSPDVTDQEVEALQDTVSKLMVFPRPTSVSSGWINKLRRFGTSLAQATPQNVLHLYSPLIQAQVDQLVSQGECEVITCEHSINEIYVRPPFQEKVRTVVNIHSSVYGSCRDQLASGTSENTLRDRINLPLLYRYEQRYTAKFSQLVVTTEEDRQQMQTFRPDGSIAVIPNGVDLERFPCRLGDPGGHRLVFVGAMDNVANIDAVRFLTLEIFPAVRQRYPDTELFLVGARPIPEIQAFNQQPGVTVTGQVPSMAEYLHRATICMVPMRTGYGIKNKTLEAMAAGVPVIASDRGLEGLAVDGPGVPLRALRASTVEEYVTAIDRLFADPELRATLSLNGRSLIESDYTWETAGQRYEAALMAQEITSQ